MFKNRLASHLERGVIGFPTCEKALLHEANALTLTLTAPESYGIEPGQPLILHGVKIGQVIER
ncbi:hypothetical protein MJN85_27680, partial [Salmonella enterica subsp. enterica serovar Anatum]|nr:hypothetical protein [Salmonella enterica subsp. enterica serovar Anatum]